MRRGAAIAVAAIATWVAAQDSAPTAPESAAVPTIKGGDPHLLEEVRSVAERVAGILRVDRATAFPAVRADRATRAAESNVRAARLLAPRTAAARGRAWRDLGFGTGGDPQDLVAAIEGDLPGMTFDGERARLLVDPDRLAAEGGHGNPDEDPEASILLATGVAADEPVVGHYVAHARLDGPSPAGPLTTDALLARSALAEGTANLAALLLLFGGVGLENEVVSGTLRPEDALGGRLVPDAMRTASPVVERLLEFVYLDGFSQAAAIAKTGEFGRLTQERKRRHTTRDVIHLDRPPAEPYEFNEPILPGSVGLSLTDRDALGEQGIVTLVSLLTGKDNLGLIAGDGWVGDALWRFDPSRETNAAEAGGATIWVTQWMTEDDAKDFVYSLGRCLEARFPGEALEPDPQGIHRVLRRADRIYRIERDGLRVVTLVAPPGIDAKLRPDAKKKTTERRESSAKH